MIELTTLAKSVQNALNDKKGFNFYISTDTADLKLPEREGNEVIEYINGIMQSVGSEITNLMAGSEKSLIYATQTCSLRLVVPLQNEEFDTFILKDGSVIYEAPENADDIAKYIQGYQTKLENVRAVLTSVFQGVTVSDMTDSAGKNFSVTTAYSLEQGGQRAQLPNIGDSYSFYVSIYYSFIENGISTKNMTFKLDGAIIPYQTVTVFRTPTMDGNVYANTKDGATKNITLQTSFSASFELPSFKDDTTTSNIINFIMNGKINQAHILTFNYNGITKDYLVTYGENKVMGETIKNVGQTLTLVECPDIYELLSFSPSYSIYAVTNVNYTYTPKDNAQTWRFWNGVSASFYDKIVSTAPLKEFTGLKLLQ